MGPSGEAGPRPQEQVAEVRGEPHRWACHALGVAPTCGAGASGRGRHLPAVGPCLALAAVTRHTRRVA